MLVDPRPYTYEFRKPRLSNPTFQSRNLYQSLYHKNSSQNDYFTPQPTSRYEMPIREENSKVRKQIIQPQATMVGARERNRSVQQGKFRQNEQIDPQIYQSNYKLPSIKSYLKEQNVQRVYQNTSEREGQQSIQRRKGFERFRVYQGQQQPFNIINCYPKEQRSNQLRNFPKLTLEDRLIERGTYHRFN